MNTITKRTIALTVAAVAVAAAVTPSFAQTRSQRMNQMQYLEPLTSQQQQRWGQTQVPAHVLNAPNDCWSDEGNGRFTSCDNGSS